MDTKKEIIEMRELVLKGFQNADMKNPYTSEPYPYFETQIRAIVKQLTDAGFGNVKEAVKEFAKRVTYLPNMPEFLEEQILELFKELYGGVEE